MKLVPIRRLARFAYGDSLAAADRIDGPIPVFGSNGSIGWHAKSNTGAPAIIVGRKGSYGALNYSAVPIFAIDTTYYIDPTQTDSNLRWLYYALQTANLDSLSVDTGVPGLSREIAYDTPIPWVDHAKQRKIADFLDRETERIDALVDKKRRLIDLLEEKRTATITHAVTKGLDPTAPMEDSGIPWLGEIPTHWETARLKLLALEPLKYGANEAADESDPTHPRYIRTTDVRSDGSLREDTYRSLPPEKAQAYMLADGDLLFTRSGATVGKSFMYDDAWGPACFAGYLIRVRLDREVAVPQFLAYFAQSDAYWRQVEATAIQATIMNVSAERYGEIRVSLPKTDEQAQIAEALDGLDKIVQQLKRSITTQLVLLAEYREALITAAVTGEIDVDTFENDRHREEATA